MMVEKSISRYSDIFSKRLPGTAPLFGALVLLSLVVGWTSVALLHYRLLIRGILPTILLNGTLAGSIAILLPTVLTVVLVKAVHTRVRVKHVLFIALVGAVSYAVFFLLGSVLHIVFGPPAATIAVIVGDASIFGWWFFINKVVLGFKKRAVLFAVAQPTLNIILFVVASRFIFALDRPLSILLLKLYAGIFIFVIVSYLLLYMFDRPVKKNLGMGGIEVFSSMLQNWLFNINVAPPFSTKLGIRPDVETNALLVKSGKRMKALFFIPEIHYGPAGSLGASNFPYILERHAVARYKTNAFIMHPAVTADRNPISSRQIGVVRAALDDGVKSASPLGMGMSYSEGHSGNSTVTKLSFGDWSMVTFTRAPRVTEDIAYDAATLFKKTLNNKFGESVIIDAHNSRYESAPKKELEGVRFDSAAMKDYVRAIASMKELHSSRSSAIGIGSVDIYSELGGPKDLGKGCMKVAVFQFGRFRYAMLYFNSNNMLPSLRNEIIAHVRMKYGIKAEVYTTDTHSVNSIEYTAENVLGRYTKFKALTPLIDKAMVAAVRDLGPARLYHKKVVMKRFAVWGPEVGDIMLDLTRAVIDRARVLSPIIIISGFIVAAAVIAAI